MARIAETKRRGAPRSRSLAHKYPRQADGYAFRTSRKAAQSLPPERTVCDMATWRRAQASWVPRPGKNARWNGVNAGKTSRSRFSRHLAYSLARREITLIARNVSRLSGTQPFFPTAVTQAVSHTATEQPRRNNTVNKSARIGERIRKTLLKYVLAGNSLLQKTGAVNGLIHQVLIATNTLLFSNNLSYCVEWEYDKTTDLL